MGDDILLRARGLTKRFGDFTAVDGIDVDVRRGEAFGFLGPNGAGKSSTMRMVGCVSPVTEGELTHPRARPGIRRPGDPGPARGVPAARHPRRGPLRRGEPLGLRRGSSASAARGARAGRRPARVRAAHRTAPRPGRAAVRRDEAAAHHRRAPHERPRGAAARRADHRPRPAGAARAVGPVVPAQARGRHAHRHDPLHGRGRAAVRPARRHGPRADRRRGQPARAHRRALDP